MKNGNSLNVLCAAQDPGGFNAIFSVIKRISRCQPEWRVRTLLANESRIIARKHRFDFIDCTSISDKVLIGLLRRYNPDVVIASTSSGLSLEKKIILWAKGEKVPSLCLVDYWTNYAMRFCSPGTRDFKYLPDAVCVIDDRMKKQLVAEGVTPNMLYVTGNPFFDTFKTHSMASHGEFILFISQPFSEDFSRYGKTDKMDLFNTRISEVNVLEDIIDTLEEIRNKLPLVISLHPRCTRRKYNGLIRDSRLKITLTRRDTEKLLNRAAVVMGINSIMLFQAAIMGKRVVSYQPGTASKDDALISNRLKLSHAAYSRSQLKSKLLLAAKKSFPMAHESVRKRYVNNDCASKVINVIKKQYDASKKVKNRHSNYRK